MADPFIAEIRIFPFGFAPLGWAFCNGQLIPIQQNTALFSLLGTTYGGDGRSNFALPNLQGSLPVHAGQGSGLSLYSRGETGGVQTVTLNTSQIALHNHNIETETQVQADKSIPGTTSVFARSKEGTLYQGSSNVTMNPSTLAPVGGGQPHNNLMPYLTLNFCIALRGVFPQRG